MAEGAEVGLQRGDGRAVAAHAQRDGARGAGDEVTVEGDGEAVDLRGARGRRVGGRVAARDLDGAGERDGGARRGGEVGVEAVGARLGPAPRQ